MPVEMAVLPSEVKSTLFQHSELCRLDRTRIPRHVAIIPDGNRRWAKKRLFPSAKGHAKGADTLMDIVLAAQEIGIESLTIYSFSTENWTRPPEEVTSLLILLNTYLTEQRENMVQKGIKISSIGDVGALPAFLRETIEETKVATHDCDKINLILALNYGSRNEICRAFQKMLGDFEQGLLKKEEITEETVSRYLDTHPWKDPDLLIRTSGELRISNFLLWQISYSEIYLSRALWPEFTPQHLIEAILDFQDRQRRWGGA